VTNVMAGVVVALSAVVTLATMGLPAIMLVIALAVSFAVWAKRVDWPTGHRIVVVYAVAVLIQFAHVAEEYRGEFHRLFPPVFGAEPWTGRRFLLFNFAWLAVFVAAGVGLVRGHRSAYLVALFLALGGGIGNGLGHVALAARTGGYFPGVYTGLLALIAGTTLLVQLMRPRAEVRA
jgi:hypothetical protein